jgi:hypothetical protein
MFRDLRWELIAFYDIFILAFGEALNIGSGFVLREARLRASLAEESPNKPWRWRADWACLKRATRVARYRFASQFPGNARRATILERKRSNGA